MHMIDKVTTHTFLCEKKHHPLQIKNDLRASVEDTRAAAPHSLPPRAVRERWQQRDKHSSPIWKIFSLLFGICKSQHASDVKDQHERRERKKITKSVKEICAHLNLQPPSSPIASEGEESLEIESFEERIIRFEDEIRCNSGMEKQASVVSVLTTVAWPTHPPLTHLLLIPLLWLRLMMMKKNRKAKKKTMMSEAYRRPPRHIFMLNDKGGEISIKA
jgi:hypothetical protein